MYFLNAGDQFFKQHTLADMIELLIHQKPSLVYGDVIIENNHKKSSWKKAGIFRQINHQSLLAHRDIFKNNLFNTQYQVAADFDWIMRSSQLFDIKKVNIPIAIYEKGGFSEVNYHKVLQERKIIFHDHLKGCSLWLNLLNLKRLQWKAKRNV